jgi:N-methylhydantoinase A
MKAGVAPSRVGVDIGGTFTDFVIEQGGHRFSSKVLTTPDAPERGVFNGLDALLKEVGIAPEEIGLIVHGTTLATNALIERRGAPTAFVTTEGFRDILEMRGEDRYDHYELELDLPEPLVPRRLRLTVPERVDARGRVRRPLDEEWSRGVAKRIAGLDVGSVAVGFLHSYVNPSHERRFAAILQEVLPDIPVSLSHEVSPEMREYERFSTTCANAYVQPRMAAYLAALQDGLTSRGYRCSILMMQSSGGLTTIETAAQFPVRLIESGPAGGALFARHVAMGCGASDVLSFDMGGTTAKICLIDDYAPQTARSFEAARIFRFKKGSGLPLRIPVIEMVEIGAGGGSIARVDELNRITVGPQSAGSDPGPACYGAGGTSATITDADLVTGKIDPLGFAGGRMVLDKTAATEAISASVGKKLGATPEIAAFGVNEIVDENMANAARVHAIESGKDASKRTIIAFGGAAPLHVARVAESLGVERFIVPKGAGVGSAVGFLRAPIAYEIVRSLYMPLDRFDYDLVNAMLTETADLARAVVEQASFGRPLSESRTVFMRYTGQGHEIAVPVASGKLGEEEIASLKSAFESEYTRQYSRIVPGMSIEALTWTVKIAAEMADEAKVDTHLKPVVNRSGPVRSVFDHTDGTFHDTTVVLRHELEPGRRIPGPALIVEDETTTLVTRLFDAVIDPEGNIECRRKPVKGA